MRWNEIDCSPVQDCPPAKDWNCKKKEVPMNPITVNVEAPTPPNLDKGRMIYLKDRAYDVFHTHNNKLQQQFGLQDDDPPQSAKEVVERIKAGMYVLPDENDYDDGYYSIQWRDPAKKKDKDGYRAARVFLDKDHTAVKDKIVVCDPETGLAALQEWEAKTY